VLREVSQTSSNRDYILKELYMCEGGLGHLYDMTHSFCGVATDAVSRSLLREPEIISITFQ